MVLYAPNNHDEGLYPYVGIFQEKLQIQVEMNENTIQTFFSFNHPRHQNSLRACFDL